MNQEEYSYKITAETSEFKKKLKEASNETSKFQEKLDNISKYIKAFGEGVGESFKTQWGEFTDSFKPMLKEIEDGIKTFGKKAKENAQAPEITSGYDKQIEYIEKKLENLKEKMSLARVQPGALDTYKALSKQLDEVEKKIKEIEKAGEQATSKDYSKLIESRTRLQENMQRLLKDPSEEKTEKELKLEAQYQKLLNVLDMLIDKQEEYNDELEETDDQAKKTSINLGGMFDKSISKIKRFTYYLLGARSVFSLFMRYRSTVFQFNEELQYESELSTNAIALSLTPAFEFLGDVIAYTSIAIAKFIELLTGVPVLSKITTKGIRDYNKALKESQSLLSGIDEITNLTLPSSTGLASQYQALEEFQKKIDEVNKFFEENKWITDLANGIRDLIDWVGKFIDKIGGAEGALKLLGGVAVMGAIGKLIGIAGSGAVAGTGLAGIAGLLTFIAGTFIITLVLEGEEEFNKIKEGAGKPANEKKYQNEILQQINELKDKLKTLPKHSEEYNETLKEINTKWESINSTIQRGGEDIINDVGDAKDLANELTKITGKESYKNSVDISEQIGLERAKINSRTFWQEWAGWFVNQKKVDSENYREKKALYDKEANDIREIEDRWGFVRNGVEAVIDKVNELNRKQIDEKIAKVSVDYKVNKTSVQNLIDKIRGISVNLMGMPESTFNSIANNILKKIGYAKGLDYVPYDNYPAMLHKGEAVVPAKYNPTIHSQGNEETNSLLETLIIKVDDLANRPIEFNIDGQQLARTTYPLLENERRNYSYSEGVRR